MTFYLEEMKRINSLGSLRNYKHKYPDKLLSSKLDVDPSLLP